MSISFLINSTKSILNKADHDYIVKAWELLDVTTQFYSVVGGDNNRFNVILEKGWVLILKETQESKNVFDEISFNYYLNAMRRLADMTKNDSHK